MSDNSFEYITTDYMVSVNPIEDTQSPTVEYIVELGQQGLPGAKGEPGEPGFSPVVTSVIDNDTIKFTLVNKDEVTTTPNFYDLLAKKDLSNTTYADDMANKLDKNGSNINRDFSITNHSFTINSTTIDNIGRIIGNSNGALYLRDAGGNTSLSVNSQGVSMLNNIGQSFTINGKQIATVDQIPDVPDVSNFLNKDGSNATNDFTVNGVELAGNYVYINKVSSGGINILQTNSDIYAKLGVDSSAARLSLPDFNINSGASGNITLNTTRDFVINGSNTTNKTYYHGTSSSKEIATKGDIPTVGNGVITIKQGNVTKGTFTTNQSGNATIELDEGGGGSYTEGTGIDITNNVISIDNTVALKTDIPDVSNFVTNTSLATTLASYVTSANLTTILTNYALTSQIPTVNNPTITFTQGGVKKGSITLNQSSNQTIALDAGGSGGVTNPIALSETIGGNTYNLNIGIDKTTGNLQGTYSYSVPGGYDTVPLFSRSYGLVSAGLSNNYTTVDGFQINQLSVKVDNSTIGFNNNGALTVTGSYASTTDLDNKVSKSGDTMTGTLDINTNSKALIIPVDNIRNNDNGNYQDIEFQYNNIRIATIRGQAYDNGTRRIDLGAHNADGSWGGVLSLIQESGGTSYAICPTPADNQDNTRIVTGAYLKKHVDGQWVSKVVALLDNVTMNNTSRSISMNNVLPNDGRIYEVLFNVYGRTGTANGNYVILGLNGNIAGACEVSRAITRSASYANCGGNCIIPCRYNTNITLSVTSNANATNICVTARAYRRVGINT